MWKDSNVPCGWLSYLIRHLQRPISKQKHASVDISCNATCRFSSRLLPTCPSCFVFKYIYLVYVCVCVKCTEACMPRCVCVEVGQRTVWTVSSLLPCELWRWSFRYQAVNQSTSTSTHWVILAFFSFLRSKYTSRRSPSRLSDPRALSSLTRQAPFCRLCSVTLWYSWSAHLGGPLFYSRKTHTWLPSRSSGCPFSAPMLTESPYILSAHQTLSMSPSLFSQNMFQTQVLEDIFPNCLIVSLSLLQFSHDHSYSPLRGTSFNNLTNWITADFVNLRKKKNYWFLLPFISFLPVQ